MPTKPRIDQFLVAQGLVASRELAQALIMASQVLVNDVAVTKAGARIDPSSVVRIRGELPRYVSRGGDKLEGALRHFAIDVTGLTAIDVGSSTGGFTDCLLQHGAQGVYAVDVGFNQLAHRLRTDCRVKLFERTHAKDLTLLPLLPQPTFGVIDVSFIALRKVLPWVVGVMGAPYQLLALIKPQFELGPEYVQKGGVVKDDNARQLAVRLVCEELLRLRVTVSGTCPSEVLGGKSGNQEYFVLASAGG